MESVHFWSQPKPKTQLTHHHELIPCIEKKVWQDSLQTEISNVLSSTMNWLRII